MNNKSLNDLVDQLTALGEDKDELKFWKEYFEIMDDAGKQKLTENLKKEFKDLSSSNKLAL